MLLARCVRARKIMNVHADIVKADRTIEVEAMDCIISKFSKIRRWLALVYKQSVSMDMRCPRMTLTVTIKLTWTTNGQLGLAGILLIGTELAFGAFGRNSIAVLSVAKWVVVFPTSLQIAKAARVAVCNRITV